MSEARHLPVMLEEAIHALNIRDGGVYVDATLGAGGYARAILAAADCSVYAFDRDPRAIAEAQEWASGFAGRLTLVNRAFAEMEEGLKDFGVEAIDGAVFDIGVSSMHLDEPERGFSFRFEGPLSMRMDGAKPDAADVVAHADAGELTAIFKAYGEERHAGRIARAIVAARAAAPITSTTALAAIIEKAAPPRGASKIHPATRVFQALRIFVNDELGQLLAGLRAAERLLKPAGRLVVVSFHSLEDRIVKRFLANRAKPSEGGSRHMPAPAASTPSFQLVHAKAVAASPAETAENPRARSAKLRAAERRATPPFQSLDDELGLAKFHLPSLEGVLA